MKSGRATLDALGEGNLKRVERVTSGFILGGHVVADVDEIICNDSQSDPTFHSDKPSVSGSIEAMSAF